MNSLLPEPERKVKPTVEAGFDYKRLTWSAAPPDEGPLGRGRIVEDRPRVPSTLEVKPPPVRR